MLRRAQAVRRRRTRAVVETSRTRTTPNATDHKTMVSGGENGLDRARVRLENVWATMLGVFAKAWEHKNVCFFVGSVVLMHAFGDELAV